MFVEAHSLGLTQFFQLYRKLIGKQARRERDFLSLTLKLSSRCYMKHYGTLIPRIEREGTIESEEKSDSFIASNGDIDLITQRARDCRRFVSQSKDHLSQNKLLRHRIWLQNNVKLLIILKTAPIKSIKQLIFNWSCSLCKCFSCAKRERKTVKKRST